MSRTPRVTILYDVPDWAFHNVARNVARQAAGHRVTILGRSDWFGRPNAVDRIVHESEIVVFLWRFDLLAFLDNLTEIAWRRMLGPDRPALATIVYDHLYQSPGALRKVGDPFAVSDAVACCSERLLQCHDAAPHLPPVAAILPDGVDLGLFAPGPRSAEPGRTLRVGWVGNSAWGATLATDLKGRRTVFDPAMARLTAEGHPVEVRIADAAVNRRPRAEMPGFYRDLDVLVCTSAMEGTPNPVLEAMACGAAVVATDVGIVSEVLGPLQRDFILAERSPDALCTALKTLMSDPGKLAALKSENLGRRDLLGWETRAAAWSAFFEAAQQAVRQDRGQDCLAALRAYRGNTRSGISRARRLVATNRVAYRVYEGLRTLCPCVIRQGKRLLSRGMP